MKRFLSLLLALLLLLSLSACGGDESELLFTEVPSVSDVNAQLGYNMLELESKADAITWSSAAFRAASGNNTNDAVGQLTYVSEKSTIDLRMTLDETRGTGLAGYENAGHAGSVEAPGEMFSDLNIYVIHSDLFFSEFTFTSEGHTCYLSLAKSKTDLDSYSKLLIDFVNQLVNMTETPDFVLQEQRKSDADAAKKAAEEAQKAAEEAANQAISPDLPPVSPVIPEPPAPEPETVEPTPSETVPESTGAIVLEFYDLSFKPGEGWTLHPTGGDGTYTWSMADTSIATVSEDGHIVAVAPGQTTLTCTSGDGLTANVIIRVNS